MNWARTLAFFAAVLLGVALMAFRAGWQEGRQDLLRSFEDVRQAGVECLDREMKCEFGEDFGLAGKGETP